VIGLNTQGARPRPLRLAPLCLLPLAMLAAAVPPGAPPAAPAYAPVTPGHSIEFPADYGSHPDFRTEWWYVTGWLTTGSGEALGFQITFFRTRPPVDEDNPSAFAPRQILIAHAAISDRQRGALWQAQRIRRAGLGLVQAAVGDTDVSMDRWILRRGGNAYVASIDAEDFSLQLELRATQPPLLNGIEGVSRKGPRPESASYYYSLPHLAVRGSVARGSRTESASGEAWLDHEWSSEYLDSEAVGWDWIGINLADGGALMAFRIRGARGESRWAGGTWRDAQGHTQSVDPADIAFVPTRSWQSPRTGIAYPVQWHVRVGPRELDLEPLMDDQENDTRLSTGAIYWEGAVRAYEARHLAGRGYLELTGYGEPLKLR